MSVASAARRSEISKPMGVKTKLTLLALTGLVLPGCAEVEGDKAAPTASASVDRPSTTVTQGPHSPKELECSASTSPVMLEPKEGLPGRVAEARRDISEAAVACDFERLEALAEAEGHRFTFGDADEDAFTVGALRNREIVGSLNSPWAETPTPSIGVGGCCG